MRGTKTCLRRHCTRLTSTMYKGCVVVEFALEEAFEVVAVGVVGAGDGAVDTGVSSWGGGCPSGGYEGGEEKKREEERARHAEGTGSISVYWGFIWLGNRGVSLGVLVFRLGTVVPCCSILI